MKTVTLSTFAVCLICHVGIAAQPTILPLDTYSGYFVSNRFEPDAPESFVVIASQEHFDQIFGVAFVMGDKSHRLSKSAFKSNLVLAVIKRGNALWEYKPKGATVDQGVVQLRYKASSKKTPTTTFACPLIVSVPKGEYKAVKFIENNKEIKTVDLTPEAKKPQP